MDGIAVPQKTIHEVGTVLMPKEVYQDDIRCYQEKVEYLERQLQQSKLYMPPRREETQTSLSCDSSGSGSERAGSANGDHIIKATFHGRDVVPNWDIPTKEEDLEILLREKDEIIKRKDEEYGKLRKILDDTQKDLQGVLDLNTQYLGIISQLNQLQGIGPPVHVNEKSTEIVELEGKLDESRARVEHLRRELINKDDELHLKERELDKAQKKERKYKEMLGLNDDADDVTVHSTIRRLMEEGKMHRDELMKISKDLKQSMVQRAKLEDVVTSLTRDKEKIEFHMRQQDLAIKKMNRIRSSQDAIKKAETSIATANEKMSAQLLKLPAIERAGSQLGLASTNKVRGSTQQYCMFCRQEFAPLKGLTCRVHFRPIRRGKWSCCEDECHRSAGCMQVPHFYIEVTVDRKIFITDGARYMELT